MSSAALGGIAVALWNRKALANFRDLALEDEQGTPASGHRHEAEDNFY